MFVYLSLAVLGNFANLFLIDTLRRQGRHKAAEVAGWFTAYAIGVGACGFAGFLFNGGELLPVWLVLLLAIPATLFGGLVGRSIRKKREARAAAAGGPITSA